MNREHQPTLFVGADHGGLKLKGQVRRWLQEAGYEVTDLGPPAEVSEDDYAVYAAEVASAVDRTPGSLGVLACRSAAGVVMAANRLPGVRAAVAFDEETARHAREHNDANVLGLSGDFTDEAESKKALFAWLEARPSAEERHVRRRAELDRIGRVRAEVVPGIFEHDPAVAQQKAATVGPLVDLVHLDVADGDFVPAKAFAQPAAAESLDVPLEVHLMVQEPAAYVKPWLQAGAKRLVAHVEAPGLKEFIKEAGPQTDIVIGIDLPTDFAAAEPFVTEADGLLVMCVKAGKSGQLFEESALLKIAKLQQLHPDLPIAVDGGVNERTAAALVTAGADRLVSTSFISDSADPAKAIAQLRNPWGT